ncbi:MAG TPA: TonB-dependent receptor, partial [Rhodanobacter sp.]|nr:TonB-dependent receptor [Rhodanobacter sp.]
MAVPGAAAAAEPAGQATGQSAPQTTPQQAAAAKKPKTTTLSEVTVTAQKRVENLQKVPISINVLENDQLQALHVQSFEDYVQYLPSVDFQ